MPTRTSVRELAVVYLMVCVACFAITRLEGHATVGQYVNLVIAALFLILSVRLARGNLAHFGIELGGLLSPADGTHPGPLGLFDLGRAIRTALPHGLRESAVALALAAVTFPVFALGFWWWHDPLQPFVLSLPPEAPSFVLAQLVMVALPEEAFFRGYVQTTLFDAEERRVRILGAGVAPKAFVWQAVLFALIHVVVDPNPARLAVFFPGLAFGWLRALRGSIGAAIVFHALCNIFSEVLARSWLG